MEKNLDFIFGGVKCSVRISENLPSQKEIFGAAGENPKVRRLFVCDENTLRIANRIRMESGAPSCVIPAGEKNKSWESVETILRSAKMEGLGRDDIFIAVGGGVISDLTAFAASIYMRGAGLVIVSTTLLGMVDAAVGGKTGIDIFQRKNLAGTFYPATAVYLPVETLRSLPASQIKSGLAEIIKTAVLDKSSDDVATFKKLYAALDYLKTAPAENNSEYKDLSNGENIEFFTGASPLCGDRAFRGSAIAPFPTGTLRAPTIPCAVGGQPHNPANAIFTELIAESVRVKGSIVENDPKETGGERALLNLGHTFAHALESSAGLGSLSHGEAVAWGIYKACALGVHFNITPAARAQKICRLLDDFGYQTRSPHPAMESIDLFMSSLFDDKKKQAGLLRFVVPAMRGAELLSISGDGINIVKKIVSG
jgi:3-dehydroquinate synthase